MDELEHNDFFLLKETGTTFYSERDKFRIDEDPHLLKLKENERLFKDEKKTSKHNFLWCKCRVTNYFILESSLFLT